MTQLAWKIHAEGYRTMGFVKSDAVTDEGYLDGAIDKARGESVDYYIAARPNDESESLDAATLRKISLASGSTIDRLPAYQLCKDALYPEGEEYLRSIESPSERIKEIGAMARTEVASPLAVFELLRNSVHESLGRQELWFFSIVSSTYDTLSENFGSHALRQIGEPISINDQRVNKDIVLIPAVADIDQFFANIYTAVLEEQLPGRRLKKMRSLLFFTDGIVDAALDESISLARSDAYRKMRQQAS